MANKNSGVAAAFAAGAGLKTGNKGGKCPPGFVKNASGKCVKYNPFKDGRKPKGSDVGP
tara:strand:- start:69 stop:245 length:177 start_codon:yes stop_codon:yes gene_type:complete